MHSIRKFVALGAALLLVPVLVAGCGSTATTSASCAFISGTGQNRTDAKLHKIVYPGQVADVAQEEKATYVPCNSRNYIITDGVTKNANGDVVGDRNTPIVATIPISGVSIKISATAYWTINQSDQAIRDFYNVCFKYQCASDQDVSGGTNFSTKGWNGMLAENFGYSMDRAGKLAAAKVTDDIYKLHDPAQYKILGDAMSATFGDIVRATLGYPEDLFCGSGNSDWPDPTKPGQGTFACTPVRIVVDNVDLVPQQSDSSIGALTLAQQRQALAVALYGNEAGYWLGVLDAISQCKAAQVTCVFNIGGGTAPTIPISVPTAAPSPSPSPTAAH